MPCVACRPNNSSNITYMLVTIAEDCWMIMQKNADGHSYVVGNGRVYSHKREAEKVYAAMVAKFDTMVAAGVAGAWRPELKGVKFT